MSFKGRIWSQVFVFICFAAWSIVNMRDEQFSVHYVFWDVGLWLVFSMFVWPVGYQYDRMAFLAHHDVVTGIFNRRFAMDKLPKLIRTANRRRDALSLFVMDGNGLKYLNDTFGHAYGDRAIQDIAKALRRILPSDGLVIRMGGDEFLCVVPQMENIEAAHFVELLEKSIANATRNDNHSISISAGYAVFPDDGEDFEALLEMADKRMYSNKGQVYSDSSIQGSNRYPPSKRVVQPPSQTDA